MAKTSALVDNFDDNSLDTGKWAEWTGGDVSETSQQLRITSTTSSSYKGMESVSSYDLIGSYAVVELVHALTGLTDDGTFLQLYLDVTNTITLFVYNDTLTAEKQVAGSYTTIASTAYNGTNHRWLRIREASGTVYFDTSADGLTWNNFTSTPNPFTLTALVASLFIGTDSANAGTDTAIFDNFNVISSPVQKQVSSSSDDGSWWNEPGGFDSSDTYIRFYDSSGYFYESYIRFININVPQGSVITSAVLTLVAIESSSSGGFDLWANDVDDAVSPTTQFGADTLVKTTATIRNTTAWTSESLYDIEVTDIVQEIINRDGWSANNALMFLGEAYSTDYNQGRLAYSYDGDSTKAPVLTINYVVGNSNISSLEESVGITDALDQDFTHGRKQPESLGATDTISRTTNFTRELTDEMSLLELVEYFKSSNGQYNDSGIQYSADNVYYNGGQIFNTFAVHINETLGLTDQIIRLATQKRTNQDTLSIDDSLSRQSDVARSTSDSEGLTDILSRVASVTRSLSNNLGITDVISTSKEMASNLSDSLGLTDSLDHAMLVSSKILDNLGLTDLVSRVSSFNRKNEDSEGLTDSVSKSSGYQVFLADNQGLTDLVNSSIAISVAIQDTVGITDSLDYFRQIRANLVDTLGFLDSVIRTVEVTRKIDDNMSLADDVQIQSILDRFVTDDLGLTDDLVKVSAVVQKIQDAIGLTDLLSQAVSLSRSIVDSEGLEDQVYNIKVLERILQDSEGLTDVLDSFKLVQATLSDTVGVTDSVSRLVRQVGKTVTKFVGIKEVRPVFLSVSQNKAGLKAVITTKPTFNYVAQTLAEFQTTDTIYNFLMAYNNPDQVYGGSDRRQSLGKISNTYDFKPKMRSIGEI
jgi:hypothetical protein